jgi:hypothetical protein
MRSLNDQIRIAFSFPGVEALVRRCGETAIALIAV